jgi:hypothetical protein
MIGRVVILTGNHLCNNPRVIKEAGTLARAGYDVTVLGAWLDRALKDRDQKIIQSAPFAFVPVLDFTVSKAVRLFARARSKMAHVLHRYVHAENRWQLGYAYSALRRAAFARAADLYIAHSEQALAVALDLLRAGRTVAVDFEDWFSEDLLPQARAGRPLAMLRSLECELLTRTSYASCPSRAMSLVLARERACDPPRAIYNAFAWADRALIDGERRDRRGACPRSIHWFSQTLGPGRGLEDLLAALPHLDERAEIHLRGAPAAGFEAWLRSHVPEQWRELVFVHPVVHNHELLSRIAEHDIGFAGEMKYCRSRDLTVTNKILYFLLAGLAVVASDTAGHREVAEQAAGAVWLYPPGNAPALAASLNSLLRSSDRLERSKHAALAAAQKALCWERQEPVLLEAVGSALRQRS